MQVTVWRVARAVVLLVGTVANWHCHPLTSGHAVHVPSQLPSRQCVSTVDGVSSGEGAAAVERRDFEKVSVLGNPRPLHHTLRSQKACGVPVGIRKAQIAASTISSSLVRCRLRRCTGFFLREQSSSIPHQHGPTTHNSKRAHAASGRKDDMCGAVRR